MKADLNLCFKLLNSNFSLITVSENKIPNIKWKDYQIQKMSNDAFENFYKMPNTAGVGIVTGYEGLEVLDIDLKVLPTVTERNDALKWICEQSAERSDHPDVFPCTWISKDIHESVYKVRKCMKELESDGYVKKSSEGGFDDGSCEIYCIHGYALTKKGYEHKYYKDAYNREVEWLEKHIYEKEI